jgi:hypothetical protein
VCGPLKLRSRSSTRQNAIVVNDHHVATNYQ